MMLLTLEPAPELPEGCGNRLGPHPVPAAGGLGWKQNLHFEQIPAAAAVAGGGGLSTTLERRTGLDQLRGSALASATQSLHCCLPVVLRRAPLKAVALRSTPKEAQGSFQKRLWKSACEQRCAEGTESRASSPKVVPGGSPPFLIPKVCVGSILSLCVCYVCTPPRGLDQKSWDPQSSLLLSGSPSQPLTQNTSTPQRDLSHRDEVQHCLQLGWGVAFI